VLHLIKAAVSRAGTNAQPFKLKEKLKKGPALSDNLKSLTEIITVHPSEGLNADVAAGERIEGIRPSNSIGITDEASPL
jgi:hypothetical protein